MSSPHPSPSSAAAPKERGGPTDPSHDEDLRRGILATVISRPVAGLLAAAFLLFIYAVPVGQAVLEKLDDEDSMLLDVVKRAPTKENLKQYEEDLENAARGKDWIQPRLQLLLSRFGRAGNKKAVIGRDGWLFYGPGVAFVAGPPFLDPAVIAARELAAREEGAATLHADPRPAVLALHQALGARGIRLVLLPMPDKAAMQPRELHGRGATGPAPVATNPDLPRFTSEMRAAGVLVFDATPAQLNPGEAPRFLVQDTHWNPTWMQVVADALAAFIKTNVALPEVPAPSWKTVALPVARVGDIVDMLKLPREQTAFAPESVSVQQVQNADGSLWEPRESGDVLLMGDSFTNVFSLAPMGWGEAAGLAPQLARALGRDLDVIAQNDSGAFATRKLLSEALAAGEDRLKGKRVVVWQFASRELGVGDWKPFSFAVGSAH